MGRQKQRREERERKSKQELVKSMDNMEVFCCRGKRLQGAEVRKTTKTAKKDDLMRNGAKKEKTWGGGNTVPTDVFYNSHGPAWKMREKEIIYTPKCYSPHEFDEGRKAKKGRHSYPCR